MPQDLPEWEVKARQLLEQQQEQPEQDLPEWEAKAKLLLQERGSDPVETSQQTESAGSNVSTGFAYWSGGAEEQGHTGTPLPYLEMLQQAPHGGVKQNPIKEWSQNAALAAGKEAIGATTWIGDRLAQGARGTSGFINRNVPGARELGVTRAIDWMWDKEGSPKSGPNLLAGPPSPIEMLRAAPEGGVKEETTADVFPTFGIDLLLGMSGKFVLSPIAKLARIGDDLALPFRGMTTAQDVRKGFAAAEKTIAARRLAHTAEQFEELGMRSLADDIPDHFVQFVNANSPNPDAVLGNPARRRVALEAYNATTGKDLELNAIGRLPGETIQMSMVDVDGPVIRRKDIVDAAEGAVNTKLTIRDKTARKALGVFSFKKNVGMLKDPADMDTLLHEFGHSLEYRLFAGQGPSHWPQIHQELEDMGRALYGSIQPNGGYAREGFAEFLWMWTGLPDEVQKRAPLIDAWFTKEILEKNPKFARKLLRLRNIVTEYRAQGPLRRMLGQFAKSSRPDKFDPVLNRFVVSSRNVERMVFDEAAFFKEIDKRLGAKWPEHLRPWRMHGAYTGVDQAAATRALGDLQADIDGRVIGPGFASIMDDVIAKNNVREFSAYWLAKHHEHSMSRSAGQVTAARLEDARAVIAKIESDPAYAHVVRAKENAVRYLQNELMTAFKEFGGEDLAKRFMDANPHYMPAWKQLDEILYRGRGQGSGKIARRYGSSRMLRPLFDQIYDYTSMMRRKGFEWRTRSALMEIADNADGMGMWAVEVPPSKVKDIVPLDKIARQLEALGADLSQANMDGLLELWRRSNVLPTTDPIIPVRVGEKTKYLRLHPQIYASLEMMKPQSVSAFWKLVRGITNVQKLGATGVRGGFAIANFFARDMFTSMLRTQRPMKWFEIPWKVPLHVLENIEGLLRASRAAVGDLFPSLTRTKTGRFLGLDKLFSDTYVRFYRSVNLEMSELIAKDKDFIRLFRRKVRPNIFRDVSNLVVHPFDSLRTVLGPFETGTRLAEMKRVLRMHGIKTARELDTKMTQRIAFLAREAGAELTTNFRRFGTHTRKLNMLKPFFNAQLQGLRLTADSFSKKNIANTMVRGLATITIPTVGLWWHNKDQEWYQKLPAWRRLGFWNIKYGESDDDILSIPIPFEFGVLFKSLPEAMLNTAHKENVPGFFDDDMKGFLDAAAKSAIPINIEMDSLDSLAWSLASNIGAAQPLVDVLSNRQWPNRPVEPMNTRDLPPRAREAIYTSATAKWLARFAYDTLGFEGSPADIDHLIDGYSGGALSDAVSMVETALGHPLKDEALREMADNAIVGRFFPRRLSMSYALREFWDEWIVINARNNEMKAHKGEDDFDEYKLDRNEQITLRLLQRPVELVRKYSQMKKSIPQTLPLDERIRLAKQYDDAILRISERAMKRLHQSRSE